MRRYARIVLSNPDMVHYGMLDTHTRWTELFAHLAYVVVDEAHTLRGVFGSHVGCILRRLRRVARHYGSDPRFILTSATIGNPGDLAERLVGVPFTEVSGDGSPRGERLFAFWNPPFKDGPTDEATGSRASRASSNWESARLLATFAGEGIRSIAFQVPQVCRAGRQARQGHRGRSRNLRPHSGLPGGVPGGRAAGDRAGAVLG